MARPIKETPILKGKDAKRFEEMVKKGKPAPKEEIEKARQLYEMLKANSPGIF